MALALALFLASAFTPTGVQHRHAVLPHAARASPLASTDDLFDKVEQAGLEARQKMEEMRQRSLKKFLNDNPGADAAEEVCADPDPSPCSS